MGWECIVVENRLNRKSRTVRRQSAEEMEVMAGPVLLQTLDA